MESAATAVELVTTAVESATATVELVAAAEPTAAVETAIATELVAAAESAAVEITTATTEVAESLTAAESAVAVIVAAEKTIAGPVVAAIEATEPGAGANENAVIEIVGAVIPVRRASVWVIPIVAIAAVGRRTDVTRTHSDAEAKSHLGVGDRSRRARKNHEKPEQSSVS
jgi:hypothetical protein